MAGRISLDTETTGLDLLHGARPYYVSMAMLDSHDGIVNLSWRWPVDPHRRTVEYDVDDLREIQKTIDDADEIVLHNAKFDARALKLAFSDAGMSMSWDWSKIHDTIIACHLVNSIPPHDLTSMVLVYLGVDVQPYNNRLKVACMKARRMASKMGWRISSPGEPDMPSVRGESWKMDGWVPGQIADIEGYPDDHEWRTVLEDYGNSDTSSTLLLFEKLSGIIEREGLSGIYLERMKVPRIVEIVEEFGVSISKTRLSKQVRDYRNQSDKSARVCTGIAKKYGYDLVLPKSGNNKSLVNFVFDVMNLPVVKKSISTGAPSLDQSVVSSYLDTLDEGSVERTFMENLADKRKRDTAIAYMEAYERFWIRVSDEWYTLHPSLNLTGTGTLRWSSNNPNEQNISKREGFNLRYCFGPAPGREWWSLDYQNLELRIPAFESGETDLVYVFEHPEDPPYYGSYHLVVADLLYPDDFRKYGQEFKDKFVSTKYKWIKNGNFAVIYGAQKSTADRAYRVDGAYEMIRSRFPGIAKLNDKMVSDASRTGYVETVPDLRIGCRRGYPIRCPRGRGGMVSPTIPLNYHVQSTAMWITMKAMIHCQEYLDELNSKFSSPRYAMVMQVHDELVFDLPKKDRMGNLPKVRKLAKLMATGGDDVGIPTPVSIEYHPDNWGTGEGIKK